MIETFVIFSGSMYYMMLSSNLFVRLKEFNAKDKMNSIKFHLPPLTFGLFCVVFSALIFGDSGQNDYYFDGVTDGSISELLHIIVIFVICPYSIYAIVAAQPVAGKHQQSFAKIKSQHIKYMMVFLICWVPASLIELFPMIVKGARKSITYQTCAQISLTLSNFGGILLFFARLSDEEVKEKFIQLIGEADKYSAYIIEEIRLPMKSVIRENSSSNMIEIVDIPNHPVLEVPLLQGSFPNIQVPKEEEKRESFKKKDEDLAVYDLSLIHI